MRVMRDRGNSAYDDGGCRKGFVYWRGVVDRCLAPTEVGQTKVRFSGIKSQESTWKKTSFVYGQGWWVRQGQSLR